MVYITFIKSRLFLLYYFHGRFRPVHPISFQYFASLSLKPFLCIRCMAKNQTLVLIPGFTFPYRFLIFFASAVVALSIEARFFSLTPFHVIAATPFPYRYIFPTPQKNRLSAISLLVELRPAPAAVEMQTPCHKALVTAHTKSVKIPRQEKLPALPADFFAQRVRDMVGGSLVALPVYDNCLHKLSLPHPVKRFTRSCFGNPFRAPSG